jgi:catechol 2,3-dioxygenase-like lactoylglutathione lyase family enzyme
MSLPAPTHVAQIAIVVKDIDRAKAWYRDPALPRSPV